MAAGSTTGSSDGLKIAIVTGSTRPGRNNEAVADWVYRIAKERKDADFELVDITSCNLPLIDEPMPPLFAQYSREHTKAWSDAAALRCENIVGGKLRLRTEKTGTPVSFPLTDSLLKELESIPSSNGYLFWNGPGKLKSRVGNWQRSLNRLFREAGVERGCVALWHVSRPNGLQC
jgi:hypothetical protein